MRIGRTVGVFTAEPVVSPVPATREEPEGAAPERPAVAAPTATPAPAGPHRDDAPVPAQRA